MQKGLAVTTRGRTLHPRHLTIAIVPGIVTAVVVVVAFFAIDRLNTSRRQVAHTHDVLEASHQVLTRTVDAETGVRAYAATGDSTLLQPYLGAWDDVENHLAQLRSLTHNNPWQQRRIARLDTLLQRRFVGFARLIGLRNAGNYTAARLEIQMGKRLMDQLRGAVANIDNAEQHLLSRREAEDRWNQRIAETVIVVGGVLAVLVAMMANGTLARAIKQLGTANLDLETQAKRLEEQASELEMQATELEATAAELEASNVELEEQAAELQEQRDTARHARVDAEQANAAKSRFLSVMSHELRTPLNAIAGYVDLMDAGIHGPITDVQQEDIRRIKRAVAQLTSVINDILNFAKLEAGEVRFDIRPMLMQEALSNATALMEPQAAAKGIHFRYDGCDASIIAIADRERVQQVVLNLLTNAVKFTAAGGEVRLECTRENRHVTVRVSDTGRGIASADIRRIFDPFVQLTGTSYTTSDGVGLGLAISRDLVRGMGGEITVQSAVGVGSVFQVTLPARNLG